MSWGYGSQEMPRYSSNYIASIALGVESLPKSDPIDTVYERNCGNYTIVVRKMTHFGYKVTKRKND